MSVWLQLEALRRGRPVTIWDPKEGAFVEPSDHVSGPVDVRVEPGVGAELEFAIVCSECGPVEKHLVREVAEREGQWHLTLHQSRQGSGRHRISLDLDEDSWDRLVTCASLRRSSPEEVLRSGIPAPMSHRRVDERRGVLR